MVKLVSVSLAITFLSVVLSLPIVDQTEESSVSKRCKAGVHWLYCQPSPTLPEVNEPLPDQVTEPLADATEEKKWVLIVLSDWDFKTYGSESQNQIAKLVWLDFLLVLLLFFPLVVSSHALAEVIPNHRPWSKDAKWTTKAVPWVSKHFIDFEHRLINLFPRRLFAFSFWQYGMRPPILP